MSSPVYELLKRPDELFVVEHAHLQPRFVEDSVRVALARRARTRYDRLDDGDFLLSRQVNLETIHTHDVLAERYGTVGELRGELGERRAGRAAHDARATGSQRLGPAAARLRGAGSGSRVPGAQPAQVRTVEQDDRGRRGAREDDHRPGLAERPRRATGFATAADDRRDEA